MKLATHLLHLRILGHLHCGFIRHKALKSCGLFIYAMSRHDFEERLIAIFANQIQSDYFGSNWYISMEAIVLEHFRSNLVDALCDEDNAESLINVCSLIFL